jgi:hypothetical protein
VRCNKYRSKKGTAGETDASFVFSWSLYNVFATNSRKKEMTSDQFDLFCYEMNQESNLRMKTVKGNRDTDEFRDY